MDILSLAKSVGSRVEAPLTDLRTVTKVLGNPHMPLLLALSKGFVEPVYRAAFLASAASSGVLAALAVRPCDLESLAERLDIDDEDLPRLKEWLDMGIRLGDLGKREGCYKLRSLPAKALAQPGNDAIAAALEEVLRFHVPALLNGPRMLREGRRFSLDDQDGLVIARSTRVIQPLVEEAIARTLDRNAPVRLLEVGCGSGTYVRYAAELNPRLSALAVDLQQDVADSAAANMAEWGLTDRVETRQADLRTLDAQPQFDLVTLHNNIYYFPEAERVEALRRAHDLLAPGAGCCSPPPARAGTSVWKRSTSGSPTPTSAARCRRPTHWPTSSARPGSTTSRPPGSSRASSSTPSRAPASASRTPDRRGDTPAMDTHVSDTTTPAGAGEGPAGPVTDPAGHAACVVTLGAGGPTGGHRGNWAARAPASRSCPPRVCPSRPPSA